MEEMLVIGVSEVRAVPRLPFEIELSSLVSLVVSAAAIRKKMVNRSPHMRPLDIILEINLKRLVKNNWQNSNESFNTSSVKLIFSL